MAKFNPTTNVYENDESQIETKTFGKENSRYRCEGTGTDFVSNARKKGKFPILIADS